MPIYVLLAAVAVVASIPLLWHTLAADRPPSREVARNLTAGLAMGSDFRRMTLSQSPAERLLAPLLNRVGRRARSLSPVGMVRSLERKIELSGLAWTVERVLAIKVCLAAVLLGSGLVWATSSPSASRTLGALALGGIGYLAPDAVLARKARERQTGILQSLPDTLDQLTICVEAGLGFDAALQRCSRSGSGPLAEEISRTLQEIRVGVPRSEALDNMVDRTDVPELRQFVHAIVQAETYGVPVANVLRSQATEQREKRRFRAEERAMKLPVKVVFPLVFCILPTMFIVILGPAGMRVVDLF